jgi:hypothetical protein
MHATLSQGGRQLHGLSTPLSRSMIGVQKCRFGDTVCCFTVYGKTVRARLDGTPCVTQDRQTETEVVYHTMLCCRIPETNKPTSKMWNVDKWCTDAQVHQSVLCANCLATLHRPPVLSTNACLLKIEPETGLATASLPIFLAENQWAPRRSLVRRDNAPWWSHIPQNYRSNVLFDTARRTKIPATHGDSRSSGSLIECKG